MTVLSAITHNTHISYVWLWKSWKECSTDFSNQEHFSRQGRHYSSVVTTVAQCLLLLWRSFLKSDKITWMCHQSYLSSGLQTCCIARVFGIQCCRSLTNTRKQKSESLCLRCINFDNFSNMRLLRPQTLWKCNTKLLRYRSKIKGQEYFCFNTHILASLHLAENKIIVTCNVLGLISHFSSKCYMDVG